MDAIGHLLRYFEPYGDVPRVAELECEVSEIRRRLELALPARDSTGRRFTILREVLKSESGI